MALRQTKRWVFYEPAPPSFLENLPEHPVLLQVLYNRGLRTAGDVTAFLQRTDAIKDNPYRLRDMAEAVTRIVRAIEKSEVICVYGDFDADGRLDLIARTLRYERVRRFCIAREGPLLALGAPPAQVW